MSEKIKDLEKTINEMQIAIRIIEEQSKRSNSAEVFLFQISKFISMSQYRRAWDGTVELINCCGFYFLIKNIINV